MKPSDNSTLAPSAGVRGSQPSAGPQRSVEELQGLIDHVAAFSLYASPDGSRNAASSGSGFVTSLKLARFNVVMQPPSGASVRAVNTFGEAVGLLNIRWFIIPNDFVARPDREPMACRFDPALSQRFVMQEATFKFGQSRDGFRGFGTGRTFPMLVGNEPQAVACAVGNLVEGFGKFQGCTGNFTLCGSLQSNGFEGHIVVRIMDADGRLCTPAKLPDLQTQASPKTNVTYLSWTGEKSNGLELANRLSFAPNGQPRGMNIPIEINALELDCACSRDLQIKHFTVGEVVAHEASFGKGSVPGATMAGTPLSPFLFDGVAYYNFVDSTDRTVGTLTVSIIEGRRFDVKFADAPDVPGLRFGWFGPVLCGSGCFEGVEGMVYGSVGAILYPPPGVHMYRPFCGARLTDPRGKFLA